MDHLDESTYRARRVLIQSMRTAIKRYLKNGARPSDVAFSTGFAAAELADGLFEDSDPLVAALREGINQALSSDDDDNASAQALEDNTVH
jgi:hypothetical protein